MIVLIVLIGSFVVVPMTIKPKFNCNHHREYCTLYGDNCNKLIERIVKHQKQGCHEKSEVENEKSN